LHSLKRLWGLSGLLFCLALSGCGGRKEIRISGAEPVSSAVVQAAGPKENLPKTGDTTNLIIPALLLLASAAGLTVVVRRKNKH
jgi:LPXTG-motif cell wall-anchored protein